jgi:CMP-N-acetylneuraminic acid synthetase
VIPARSGSKGILKKNHQLINGKSLARITLEFAIDANLFDEIILDTDDVELIESVKDLNVAIPHIRPSKYAHDNSSIIDSLRYLIFDVVKMKPSDTIVLLQPTCPFRTKKNLIDCLEAWKFYKNNCVIATSTDPLQSPKDFFEVNDRGQLSPIYGKNQNTNRQDVKNCVFITGSIYIFSPKNLMDNMTLIVPGKTLSVLTSQKEGFDIDSEYDLQIARFISEGLIKF